MELSDGTSSKDFIFKKPLDKQTTRTSLPVDGDVDSDVIDVSKLNLGNDHWLAAVPCPPQDRVKDLSKYLHDNLDFDDLTSSSSSSQAEHQKNIDTRTFTRPKKRFVRPSIEKYNEEVYGGTAETTKPETAPLNFDLTQSINSHYFDNMVANLGDVGDSFQNMSPPSLANSMCSSIFTNLMESSFIKNDPELREIRDTDFTEKVLLQDCEPPMFASISESCSSLNSDTPEGFLKKVSRSDTFKVNSNTTFDRTLRDFEGFHAGEEDKEKCYDLNETISINRQSQNETIITLSHKELNFKTHERTNVQSPKSTTTVYLNAETDHVKKLNQSNSKTKKKPVQITDFNRLSYYLNDDENVSCDETNDLNKTVTVKRSSISTGSADSLDRMSSISNGSRGSNKILNMADVDAIIEMQEKSLQQAISAPKLNTAQNNMWQNNFISPIRSSEHFSDSDVSSNDEYKSVKSSFSKTSLDNFVAPKAVKSLNYLKDIKQNNSKPVQLNIPATQTTMTNVYKSNLKMMGPKLKGSYTSLRPMSANLPVAPPPPPAAKRDLNATISLSKNNVGTNHKRLTESKPNALDSTFVKPQAPPSFLPRPTGIPRPAASRIPGPRSSSARSLSSKYALGRSDSDSNLK